MQNILSVHSCHLWIMSFILISLIMPCKNNQHVKINFFRNQKGKWLSFINLRASFQNPDVVDVDPLPKSKNIDFDQLEEEKDYENDDVTVIYITPLPLLNSISKPTTETPIITTMESTQEMSTSPIINDVKDDSIESNTGRSTTEIVSTPDMIEDNLTSSTSRQEEIESTTIKSDELVQTTEEINFPINDHIPGILTLGDIIIPHRLRHDHHKKTTTTTVEPMMSTTGSSDLDDAVDGSGIPMSIDDEDYISGNQEDLYFSSTISSVDIEDVSEEMNDTIIDDNSTTTEPRTIYTTTEEVETDSTTVLTTTSQKKDDEYYYEDNYQFDYNMTLNSSETLDDLFINDNDSDNDTFILTAREILHKDSVNRNETELRDLLTNLRYLEVEEDFGSYHRDHGGSFLLPILKSVDYDNNSVPVVFSDVPLNVLVKLNIIHLANFDSEQMEYTIDLEMEMRWFDVRLANNYSKPIRIREKEIIDLVFRPDPYFVNSKYSYFHMVSFPNFRMRILPTGLVIYTMRVTLLPSCSMTFCRFPHDSQQCDLLISSIAYSKSFVNLIWNYDAITFASRVSLPELRIKKLSTENCQVEGKLISSSCLRLVFALERDGARYIVEKYVPSTLAMMFAWVAPFVPYNYEDVRIVTPITVLLTLVQMEKGDLNVRTSYLTSIDIWFGAMKTFSVLSLVESLIVLALIKRSRAMEKQAHRATNQYSKELFESEKRRLTDLYHRLDTASRYLSPVVFIVFFVYYVLYVAQGDETYCLNRNIL